MIIVNPTNVPGFQSNFNISGAAGDPHFVGFDGEMFDYHGEKGGNYLIYDDDELKIIAKFDEPNIAIAPQLTGMTFITKLEVEVKNYGSKTIVPESLTEIPTEKIEAQTGLVRGLPKEIEFVVGQVKGMEIISFKKGQLIVTSMDSAGLHLNLAFKLEKIEFTATGILGQTSLPKNERKPNNSFKINEIFKFL